MCSLACRGPGSGCRGAFVSSSSCGSSSETVMVSLCCGQDLTLWTSLYTACDLLFTTQPLVKAATQALKLFYISQLDAGAFGGSSGGGGGGGNSNKRQKVCACVALDAVLGQRLVVCATACSVQAYHCACPASMLTLERSCTISTPLPTTQPTARPTSSSCRRR